MTSIHIKTKSILWVVENHYIFLGYSANWRSRPIHAELKSRIKVSGWYPINASPNLIQEMRSGNEIQSRYTWLNHRQIFFWTAFWLNSERICILACNFQMKDLSLTLQFEQSKRRLVLFGVYSVFLMMPQSGSLQSKTRVFFSSWPHLYLTGVIYAVHILVYCVVNIQIVWLAWTTHDSGWVSFKFVSDNSRAEVYANVWLGSHQATTAGKCL